MRATTSRRALNAFSSKIKRGKCLHLTCQNLIKNLSKSYQKLVKSFSMLTLNKDNPAGLRKSLNEITARDKSRTAMTRNLLQQL